MMEKYYTKQIVLNALKEEIKTFDVKDRYFIETVIDNVFKTLGPGIDIDSATIDLSKLRERRLKLGLKQIYVAKQLNMNQSALCCAELGFHKCKAGNRRANPSVLTVKKLHEFYLQYEQELSR